MNQNQLNELGRLLEKTSGEDQQKWLEAIETGRSYFKANELSDELLTKLAMASESTDSFNRFLKEAYRSCQTHPDRTRPFKTLVHYCDESIYSLKEWLLAYNYFRRYLDEQGRQEDLLTMLGYLQCCSLSPENKDIKHDFIDLLEAMLNQYGFVGKNPK